jgi:glucose-6-phosphate isomerase
MQLEFFNTPKPKEFDQNLLPSEDPGFLSYEPNWEAVKSAVDTNAKYKNILVIGHGGSITSFLGIYGAFKDKAGKKAYFLSTVDPDYIYELKQELKPEDTLVIAISKSGETTTQIEALLQFTDYPMLFVTGKGSSLEKIAGKLNAQVLEHPSIGGRYTAFTEVGVLPAALAGLPIKEMHRGAEEMYALYKKDNLAWRAASVMWQLEQQGFVDVFLPFYSRGLFGFSNLIVQLCHESFGKEGRGQTYAAFEAPESQHHTNQRFFGGIKNMAGFFVSQNNFNHPAETKVPPAIQSVEMKGQHLFVLNKIPLEKSMQFELEATMEDAKIHSIPLVHLSITQASPKEVGMFIAFWQTYAVYSSLLRKVDPFDQPQVENSKVISFNKRLGYKGIN